TCEAGRGARIPAPASAAALGRMEPQRNPCGEDCHPHRAEQKRGVVRLNDVGRGGVGDRDVERFVRRRRRARGRGTGWSPAAPARTSGGAYEQDGADYSHGPASYHRAFRPANLPDKLAGQLLCPLPCCPPARRAPPGASPVTAPAGPDECSVARRSRLESRSGPRPIWARRATTTRIASSLRI